MVNSLYPLTILYPQVPTEAQLFLRNNLDNIPKDHFNDPYFQQNTLTCCYYPFRGSDIAAASILTFSPTEVGVWLSYFTVHRNIRRTGFGTTLLNSLKNMFAPIRLECFMENTVGFAFYKSQYFRKVRSGALGSILIWKPQYQPHTEQELDHV